MKMGKVLGNLYQKINYILSVFCLVLINCQEKKTDMINSKNIHKNIEITELESVLVRQLKNGASSEYGSFDDYSKRDLNVVINIEDSILNSNGYKIPNEKEFSDRVKRIFGRIIDYSSTSEYLKIDTYNPCDKGLVFNALSADNQNLYISKRNRIITFFYPLPLVLDYQKKYPKLLHYENEPLIIETNEGVQNITQWKNYPNILQEQKKNNQIIVARNMYLFNDNKAQFKWLILNDQYFMESLVKTFGYTEDKELLKWLILKILPKNYSNYNKNIEKEFEKLLWTKNCDGSISIHQNTLEVIKELSTPDNSDFILCLSDYIQHGLCLGCDTDLRDDLTFQQKSKIAAHLLEFGEQYKYNSKYDFNQMFLGNFYHYTDYNKNYITEFEKNKFYGLKNLKNWYDRASVEEDFFKNNDLPDNPQPIDYYYKSGK